MSIINVVAIALFRRIEDKYEILTIDRNKPPYRGNYALPGGKIEAGETLQNAALRELIEETGLSVSSLIPFAQLNEILVDEQPISENLLENHKGHFLLTYFGGLIEDNTTELIESEEGQLEWISLDRFSDIEDKFVPSDYRIIHDYLMSSSDVELVRQLQVKVPLLRHYECVVHSSSSKEREILQILQWQ